MANGGDIGSAASPTVSGFNWFTSSLLIFFSASEDIF